MKYTIKIAFSSLVALFFFSQCAVEDKLGNNEKIDIVSNDEEFVRGEVFIKFSQDIEITPNNDGEVLFTGITAVDNLVDKFNIVKMERVFRHGGKFEKRMRDAGLHRWYKVTFDESIAVTRTVKDFGSLPEIEYAEPVGVIKRIHSDVISDYVYLDENSITGNPNELPFDDVDLNKQWHYKNLETFDKAQYGSDINLFRAWEVETGKPNVIVSIHDGGIDFLHDDLKENMWVNPGEVNNNNADDDSNGYKDDIHGWNFYDDKFEIVADSHGTHVAGTVAARNNNGVGVCGVAGGDGSSLSGVKLMSCQVFTPESPEIALPNKVAESLIYAAHNGAVISQNSWGGGTHHQVIREAIGYFINNAGKDENGVQTGPMSGGIAIFATGNDGIEVRHYPSVYEEVYAVSSIGPAFKVSAFSNYGSWVDVTAPGGDRVEHYGTPGRVFSTLPNNAYGYMAGTSMACPHVSGIAALVVSKHGGDGFTADRLREILDLGCRDIEGYNPAYEGKLGAGYIDAYKALMLGVTTPPKKVNDITCGWKFESVDASFVIPANTHESKALRFEVLCWDKDLTTNTLFHPEIKRSVVKMSDDVVGTTYTAKFTGLKGNKRYYVAVCAVDVDNNYSEPMMKSSVVEANWAPEITDFPESITLKRYDKLERFFEVDDKEGDNWTLTVHTPEEPHKGVVIKKEDNTKIKLTIDASKNEPLTGKVLAITLKDATGSSNYYELSYTILKNNLPQVTSKEFKDIEFEKVGDVLSFNMTEYFYDQDGDELQFDVETNPLDFVSYTVEGDVMTIKAEKKGRAVAKLVCRDAANIPVSHNFSVKCLKDKDPEKPVEPDPEPDPNVVNIYPTIVTNVVNISTEMPQSVVATIYNSRGAKVKTASLMCSEDTPGTMDVSDLQGGNYTIKVLCNGKDNVRNIIKK